jgi:hypothetical protein
VSGTVGFLRRFEAGYSRALSSDGSTPALSPLFEGGFNIFHAKANLLGENAGKQGYLPAVSLGFVARTEVRRVGGILNRKDTHNEDVYLVATKTITFFRIVPIVSRLGFKVTNASVLGIAVNAPNWQGRLFGTLGFVVPGPVKSKIVLGSEFLQEPRHIEGLPGATNANDANLLCAHDPARRAAFECRFRCSASGQQNPARSRFACAIAVRRGRFVPVLGHHEAKNRAFQA